MKFFLLLSRLISFWCLSLLAVANVRDVPVYELNSTDTFIEVSLDHQIHFYSQDPELNNIQIRDRQGNSLPFRLLNIAADANTLERKTPAIFFPVAPNTSEDILRTLSSTSIHINTNTGQLDITESSTTPSVSSTVETPDFYLIDIRSFQQKTNQETALKLSAIGLQLDTSNNSHQTPYQLWELSASNDLHHWSVISNTSLVQLHKDGHSLIQDKIPVNIGYEEYAYLKLRCTDFCSDVQLSAISIFEESTTRPSPADIHWTLKGEASSSKAIKLEVDDTWQSKAIWEFAREDFAPIEKFSIYLGAQNYGGNIRLLGRAQSQSSWQLLYEGIWFNTQVGDKWYSSAPPILNAQDIREFRLELAHPLQTNTAPDLVLYTTPRAIQFIGNQNPPYQLWVSAQADMLAQARILNSLLNNQSPVWAKHQWEFLNSPKPNNQMQPSWKSLVFWGLLMIAVTLLALMAIKLFKQMNTPRD